MKKKKSITTTTNEKKKRNFEYRAHDSLKDNKNYIHHEMQMLLNRALKNVSEKNHHHHPSWSCHV